LPEEIPIIAILGLELRLPGSGISRITGIWISFAKTKDAAAKNDIKGRNNGFIIVNR